MMGDIRNGKINEVKLYSKIVSQ